jgi:hypothetical protein
MWSYSKSYSHSFSVCKYYFRYIYICSYMMCLRAIHALRLYWCVLNWKHLSLCCLENQSARLQHCLTWIVIYNIILYIIIVICITLLYVIVLLYLTMLLIAIQISFNDSFDIRSSLDKLWISEVYLCKCKCKPSHILKIMFIQFN